MDFLDNKQEIDSARAQRRERMKEEKKIQEAKRAMLRKMMPFIALGVVAIILLISVVIWGIRAITKEDDNPITSETVVNKREPSEVVLEEDAVVSDSVTNDAVAGDDSESVAGDAVAVGGLSEAYKDSVFGFVDSIIVVVEPPEIKKQVENMLPTTVERPNLFEGYKVDDTNAARGISEEEVQSQFATIINATTGEVLLSKNGGDRMVPASMTKVMTVLVASEHITNLEDMFTVTLEDTDYAYIHDLSSAGFEAGETVPIKDILYGAIMPSGGECCHALERYVAGSEEEFVQMMNDKAAELGLTGTHFTNSAGLYNDNHYTTLYDISMIMKAAIEDDICREVLHEHMHVTASTTNHPEGLELSNWFMRRIEDKYTNTEVMGAKTGYVVQSGNCAVSYTIGTDGTVYICATGNAHSAWRAIFDHKALYEKYVQ